MARGKNPEVRHRPASGPRISLWLQGRQAYDARIKLTEVPDGICVFVPNDTKRRKQLQQFVGIEHDSTADGSSLRGIAMETFHDDHATGTQRAKDFGRVFARPDIAQDDQVALV